MPIISSAPPTPPHKDKFVEIASHTGLTHFGFVEDWPLARRFNARYRLSRSCRGLLLDGYSQDTAAGYSALARSFLCWSALELYTKLAAIERENGLAELLSRNGAEPLVDSFTKLGGSERFFGMIGEHLDRRKHREEFAAFMAGKRYDAGKVLGAIRHIFAHGYLTPNAVGCEPQVSGAICNRLADFVMTTIDSEWTNHIEEGFAEIFGSG